MSSIQTLKDKAATLVREARAADATIDDAWVEQASQQLYVAHREATHDSKAKVNLELFWPKLTASWKSRYRNMIRAAIAAAA